MVIGAFVYCITQGVNSHGIELIHYNIQRQRQKG